MSEVHSPSVGKTREHDCQNPQACPAYGRVRDNFSLLVGFKLSY